MDKEKILIELPEMEQGHEGFVYEKKNKNKIHLTNKRNKRNSISFFLLFVALFIVIGVLTYSIRSNNQKKGETISKYEEKNKILSKEMKQMKKELKEMEQKLKQKDSYLENAYEEMKEMESKILKMKKELIELNSSKDNLKKENEIIKEIEKLDEKKKEEIKSQLSTEQNKTNDKKEKQVNEENKQQKKEGGLEQIDSKIIYSLDELEFIENRIKQNHIGKKVKYKLLYRGTRDGTGASVFHKLCDNIEGTLTVIKTAIDYKIGGYTEVKWNHHGRYYYRDDPQAFVYNLNLRKIYNSNGKNSIIPNEGFGPVFGAGVIEVYNNAFLTGGQTSPDKNYGYGRLDLNNGKFIFDLVEIEVFQIIFE